MEGPSTSEHPIPSPLLPADSHSPAAPPPPPASKIETEFVCEGFGACQKTFSRAEHLARHIRGHTGEKPFTCHCGRSFTRLDNVRQHAATVHADEVALNAETMSKLVVVHNELSSSRSLKPRLRQRTAEDDTAAPGRVDNPKKRPVKVESGAKGEGSGSKKKKKADADDRERANQYASSAPMDLRHDQHQPYHFQQYPPRDPYQPPYARDDREPYQPYPPRDPRDSRDPYYPSWSPRDPHQSHQDYPYPMGHYRPPPPFRHDDRPQEAYGTTASLHQSHPGQQYHDPHGSASGSPHIGPNGSPLLNPSGPMARSYSWNGYPPPQTSGPGGPPPPHHLSHSSEDRSQSPHHLPPIMGRSLGPAPSGMYPPASMHHGSSSAGFYPPQYPSHLRDQPQYGHHSGEQIGGPYGNHYSDGGGSRGFPSVLQPPAYDPHNPYPERSGPPSHGGHSSQHHSYNTSFPPYAPPNSHQQRYAPPPPPARGKEPWEQTLDSSLDASGNRHRRGDEWREEIDEMRRVEERSTIDGESGAAGPGMD